MENRNQNTKAVVEAGMVSALVVLITLVSMYLGLSGYAGVCILPIPITIIYLRQNLKISLITVLVSTILVGLLFNPLQAIANTFLMGLIGTALGYCIKSKFSSMKTYAIFGLVVAAGAFIYTLIYAELVAGVGIYAFVDDMLKRMVSITVKSIGNTNLNAQQKTLLASIKRIDTKSVLKLLPAALTVAGFIFAYVNYQITGKISKRLKYEIKKMIPLTRVYIPNKFGSFMIIIVLIGYILTLNKIFIGDYIWQSALLILASALAISGMSLTAYYLRNNYKVSKKIVIVIFVAAFIFSLYQTFVILGLVDLVMNFRKLDPNPILKK